MAPRPPTERQVRLAQSAKKSTAGRAGKRSVASLKASGLRASSTASEHPEATPRGYPTPSASFSTSKRDKQAIKHSLLLHKIENSAVKKLRRRRPNKKLVANLENLMDALPELGGESGEIPQKESEAARRHRKAYGSRPGALKRRDKAVREEREFVGKALAVITSGDSQSSSAEAGSEPTENKWELIRKAISRNMSNG